MKFTSFAGMLGLSALSLAGCRNPAEGKAAAEVGEARAVKKDLKARPVESLALTPRNTQIGWVGSKVTGSHTGAFARFAGKVETFDRTESGTRIQVEIDMSSVTSDNPRLTGHLKSKDFFWVSKFPKARFVSTRIKKGGKKGATHTITGNLTLRGVTRSVAFPAVIDATDDKITVRSEFWINRRLWNVNYPGMPNDLIRNEVVLKLAIRAKRKKV